MDADLTYEGAEPFRIVARGNSRSCCRKIIINRGG